MRSETKALILFGVWAVIAVAQLWSVQYETAKAQYYHAVMALEATQEAETAWDLIVLRHQRDPKVLPMDLAYVQDKRGTMGELVQEVKDEVQALETRLAALSLGRFTPEDR